LIEPKLYMNNHWTIPNYIIILCQSESKKAITTGQSQHMGPNGKIILKLVSELWKLDWIPTVFEVGRLFTMEYE